MHEFLFSDPTGQMTLPGLSILKASSRPAGFGLQAAVDRPAILPLRWEALVGIDAALLRPAQEAYQSGQLAHCAELLVQLAARPVTSVIAGARCLIQAAACQMDIGASRDATLLVRRGLRQLTSVAVVGAPDLAIGPTDWLAFAAEAISVGDGDAALTWSVRAARSLKLLSPQAALACSAHRLTGDALAVYGATMILNQKVDAGCDALRYAFRIHSDSLDDEAAAVDLLSIALAEAERSDWTAAERILQSAAAMIQPRTTVPGWPRAGRILRSVQELQRCIPAVRRRNSAECN